MRRALESLDLLVAIDIYDNATAHYADYVLPATDMFERPDINLCGLGMQRQPFVQYTSFIVPPKAERRPEWWILGRIEQAQGFDSIFDEGDAVDYAGAFDQYGLWNRFDHMLKHSGTSVRDIMSQPSQTVVLPLPRTGRFFESYIQTESGRIDCCPPGFAGAIKRCHVIFDELKAECGQLKMISRRTNYMINSWFHNVQALKRPGHESNPLYMRPDDAGAHHLADGSRAVISNRSGRIETVVALDDSLKPGTVAMTHGWGNAQTGMTVARRYPGTSPNDLLPTGPGSYEKISNQAFMTGVPVTVEAG